MGLNSNARLSVIAVYACAATYRSSNLNNNSNNNNNNNNTYVTKVTHLLLVVESPGDFVVVTCAEVDHDVLVAEKEHHGAGVVQLVHVVEVGHLRLRERAVVSRSGVGSRENRK